MMFIEGGFEKKNNSSPKHTKVHKKLKDI